MPVSTWLPTLPVPKRRNGLSLFALLSVTRSGAIEPLPQTNGCVGFFLRDTIVTARLEETPEWTRRTRTRYRDVDGARDIEPFAAVCGFLAWRGSEVILHMPGQILPDNTPRRQLTGFRLRQERRETSRVAISKVGAEQHAAFVCCDNGLDLARIRCSASVLDGGLTVLGSADVASPCATQMQSARPPRRRSLPDQSIITYASKRGTFIRVTQKQKSSNRSTQAGKKRRASFYKFPLYPIRVGKKAICFIRANRSLDVLLSPS
jgi:hypothetical protein